jgi:hypothetical protein
MAEKFSIIELEAAINRSKAAQPPHLYALAPDTRVLSALYGLMIFYGLKELSFSALSAEQEQALRRWQAPT